jgi:hypothetical protein
MANMTTMTLPHAKDKDEAWRVERHGGTESRQGKVEKGATDGGALVRRLFRRAEPSTFHRCLAVHMYFARHPSALE